MQERISHWKYNVGDTVKAGACEDVYKIEHQTADITSGRRFYVVSGMKGQETKCAHEFEEQSELITKDY